MKLPQSLPLRQIIPLLSLAAIALLSSARVVEYDPVPWEWVAASAIGTVILVGPIMWIIRDRLPEERRENLTYLASGIALLCVPILLGFGLISGNLLLVMDTGTLGGIIGFAVALLVEKTVIPERLQGTTQ